WNIYFAVRRKREPNSSSARFFEGRGQKTEDRGQRTDDSRQPAGGNWQQEELRGLKADDAVVIRYWLLLIRKISFYELI
ncbi:MAG: hypothetical protein P8075_20670, partial [Deltaproteobacteria bacterium]